MSYKTSRFDMLVSDLCAETDYLHEELEKAKEEAKHYRNKYSELLTSSYNHSQAMFGNTLEMLLIPGVSEALIENGGSIWDQKS